MHQKNNIFGSFLNFWLLILSQKVIQKFQTPPVTRRHMSDIQMPNLVMIQLTLFNWLSMESSNAWNYGIFWQKVVLWRLRMMSFCFRFSRAKSFPLWSGTITQSFIHIQSGGAPDLELPKGCSLFHYQKKFPCNLLNTNPTKWSNTLKQFVGFCRWIVWVC